MKKSIVVLLAVISFAISLSIPFATAFAQKDSLVSSNSSDKISINGFRNPSIGAEYQRGAFSVHAGYYITALEKGVTTQFVKVGVTHWVFPTDKKEVPSSFYISASYLRGFNNDHKDENALGMEIGYRYTIIKGLNVRLGVMALASPNQTLKINPTPGISYTFNLN